MWRPLVEVTPTLEVESDVVRGARSCFLEAALGIGNAADLMTGVMENKALPNPPANPPTLPPALEPSSSEESTERLLKSILCILPLEESSLALTTDARVPVVNCGAMVSKKVSCNKG